MQVRCGLQVLRGLLQNRREVHLRAAASAVKRAAKVANASAVRLQVLRGLLQDRREVTAHRVQVL